MSANMVLQGQSDPIKLRVLIIGYDPVFLASVSEFLHLLKHQVWTYSNPFVAFSALRVRRNFYDLIMTDLYLADMDGFEVQKRVREEFKLPLIIVSSDDREHVILKALKLGAVHYIVKPVCFNDMKNLWKFVVNYSDKSRKEISLGEEIEGGAEQSSPKVVWTQELQARFLDSVHFIGLERAVPKTILEVMNVEGLTRENVASHLQKYRQFLRRVAARISVSKSDILDESQMSRSTFGNSRTSIFQQQPICGQNLSMNLNSSNLSRPLSGANDHHSSTTSANNVQCNNGLQTQASPLTTHLYGNYNNHGKSAGFHYENNFNNGSWNDTIGSLNDSNSLNTNNNYYDGFPMSSAASAGLAGINLILNPNLMVVNDNWSSSTSGLNTNFVGIVLNDIDQNEHHQDMNNASPKGNLIFGYNDFSGGEDASSVGFCGMTTVEVAASSSNVVDASRNQNQTDQDFDDLHDILFNDTNLESVNEDEGKQIVNYESSVRVVQENASLLKECNGAHSAQACIFTSTRIRLVGFIGCAAILENISLDEDWKKFTDSFLN
ncbi:hypothetical protein M0R45_035273 [Rubus argutus]|uniref:Response regulatory domain-containing protein n=1 Tax=Rubus argutus TaxID=59490 RepID=A0AAW1VTH3_RUBAR